MLPQLQETNRGDGWLCGRYCCPPSLARCVRTRTCQLDPGAFSVGKMCLWTSVRDRGGLCKANCAGPRAQAGGFPALAERHSRADLKGMLPMCWGRHESGFLLQPSSPAQALCEGRASCPVCRTHETGTCGAPTESRRTETFGNLPRCTAGFDGLLTYFPQASDSQRADMLHFTCMNTFNPPQWSNPLLVSLQMRRLRHKELQ